MAETTPTIQPSGAPSKIEDFPVVMESIEFATKGLDFSSNHLVTIIKNKSRVIRKLPKGDVTNAYLLGEIREIATAYGGDRELPSVVQKECVKALQNEFKSLSMPEVWAAFRAHSAGELPDVKGRGESYGGKMTAKSFAAVLGAWKKYKSEAVSRYIDKNHRDEQAKRDKLREARMKAESWPTMMAQLKKLIDSPGTDWRDCPSFMFEALRKRGLIPGLEPGNENPKVWQPIWEDAGVLAENEAIMDKEEEIAKRGKVRLIGEVAIAKDNEVTKLKRKKIAKKLALFRLVIKNESTDLESFREF